MHCDIYSVVNFETDWFESTIMDLFQYQMNINSIELYRIAKKTLESLCTPLSTPFQSCRKISSVPSS